RDTAAVFEAQRTAMQPLAVLDGTWRGTSTYYRPDGATFVSPHTERIGPFLDGTVKVIEGRSFKPDGSIAFNAFAILSYDPATKAYNFRSYAMGHANDFPFEPTSDGFKWETTRETEAGTVTTRYTTTIENGTWLEIGERLVPGQAPVRFIELELQRMGDSDWPAAGAIGPG
ncbi:MAG TPA: hypothetical protein VFS99_06675, partial [Xanthomonadaceae bacterium]|nr:hypothetical protein [Xanthomonadaceae bacterium]